jgi:hypothetical protein
MVEVYTGELPRAVTDEHFALKAYHVTVSLSGRDISKDLEGRQVKIERERLENVALAIAARKFRGEEPLVVDEHEILEISSVNPDTNWIANSRLAPCSFRKYPDIERLAGIVEVEAIGYARREKR